MDAYADQIYGLGLRMCSDPEHAEDLVQETFIRAYRAWPGFDGRSKPSTWLYTIATRTCLRMQRRRSGEPGVIERLEELLPIGETEVLDLAQASPTPLEWVQREEVVEAVRRAVRRLPMKFRLPVVLKELEGMKVEEVAAILGLKGATVKTRLHRARLAIRRALLEPLPRKPATETDSSDAVCMDLLWAKQEALDRGVSFPIPGDHLCERCNSVFATLDLADKLCYFIGDAPLPQHARRELRRRVASLAG